MIDIDKQLDYFNWLNYEEKKSHLLEMLEKIKDKHEVFLNNYNTLKSTEDVSDLNLNNMYKLIFEVSNWLENNKKATEEELTNKMWSYIDKLREEERLIREKEHQEADQLLENI